MTQAAPKVFQMNQNVLLAKLMPITLTDIVHKLSFMKKKTHLFLQFIVTDNSDLHRGATSASCEGLLLTIFCSLLHPFLLSLKVNISHFLTSFRRDTGHSNQ